MEAGGISLKEWAEERFRTIDARIRSNHDKIAKNTERLGDHGTSLRLVQRDLNEVKEDVTEMRRELKIIRWGLFSAIAVGLMFVVAVATLIVQIGGPT